MRLFIGVALPDPVLRAAAESVAEIRDRLSRAAPRASLRWVAPANLHVTLWFLGERREPANLLASLQRPLPVAPFSLGLAPAGAFPDGGPPRTLWIGIGEGRHPLVAIYDALRLRLAPLGIEPEARPFSPHLTIARVKDISRSDGRIARQQLAALPIATTRGDVHEVTLFSSKPTSHGSEYTSVLRVPLG